MSRILLTLFVSICSLAAADHYVSPDGSPENDGSLDRPWDLKTGLSHASIQPGDYVWLRGGVYAGVFVSTLKGTEHKPIVVRQYPGESAVIDGASETQKNTLTVRGEHTHYWGFSVTNSNPQRDLALGEVRGVGIDVFGPYTKFIHLTVHNTGQGFGLWSQAIGAELYGNIIVANGWVGPDRRHGHGIYMQNETGTKRVVDNLVFNQFGYGFHAYGSPRASLKGFYLEGNVSFNNAFLIGGQTPVRDVKAVENYFYGGDPVSFGYGTLGGNSGLHLQSNYFGKSNPWILWWSGVQFKSNVVYQPLDPFANVVIRLESPIFQANVDFDCNTYVKARADSDRYGDFYLSQRGTADRRMSFSAWRTDGFDTHSKYLQDSPLRPGDAIFVRPSTYERGRAHVIAYNWSKQESVDVDLSKVLQEGDNFEVTDVQNLSGDPVLTASYEGKVIKLPLTSTSVTQPVGESSFKFQRTPSEFAVFLVRRLP
jgi:hypothetical protein